MEEGRGRREMLRVYMTRGRGKEPETEFCNVTKKGNGWDRKGGCSIENWPPTQCIHCLRTIPYIICIQFHPLQKLFLTLLLLLQTNERSTNRSISSKMPISAPFSRGREVTELMIGILYFSRLFTLWWTTNKSITVQMDCIIKGL